uniref:Uncharacterized protein n=1 Tax=Cacopsylla melanoneura TaxID=428564 RepID=A0A8D8VPP9_9HEMI
MHPARLHHYWDKVTSAYNASNQTTSLLEQGDTSFLSSGATLFLAYGLAADPRDRLAVGSFLRIIIEDLATDWDMFIRQDSLMLTSVAKFLKADALGTNQ